MRHRFACPYCSSGRSVRPCRFIRRAGPYGQDASGQWFTLNPSRSDWLPVPNDSRGVQSYLAEYARRRLAERKAKGGTFGNVAPGVEPSHDRRAVLAFLRACADRKATVRIVDRDDGPMPLALQDIAADAAEVMATDDCVLAVAVTGERAARFLFVFGNGPGETVADYTDNALGNTLAQVATDAGEGAES